MRKIYLGHKLGETEIRIKLKITFCKNVIQAVERKAIWTDKEIWEGKKGRARQHFSYSTTNSHTGIVQPNTENSILTG